ncbi:sugar phosphate nucleotidyltransferase [Streptomyces sp. NPDC056254]|uniref:sugar phosphate nucleotidyltransferase n=1 Tax=Streptomyces sp. NPDC056254 TaxID=3345763 RepID=UPI0035D6968B
MKAVIAVAGMGARFFPISKTINKCMLPILDQPVVAYAVADCLAAGADHIAIVTGTGETGSQVRHYFTEDTSLKDFFTARGWQDKYQTVAHLHDQAAFTFIEQPRDGRHGTALPVMLAAEFVDGEDFLFLTGGDFLLRTDGGHDVLALVTARAMAGTPGAMAAATVPGAMAHRYGVLTTKTNAHGHLILDSMVEKPSSYQAATAYINVSRALLSGQAMPYFDALRPAASNGEYQATDAIAAYARDHDVLIHAVAGQYHDCGDATGWLAANLAAASVSVFSVATDRVTPVGSR